MLFVIVVAKCDFTKLNCATPIDFKDFEKAVLMIFIYCRSKKSIFSIIKVSLDRT